MTARDEVDTEVNPLDVTTGDDELEDEDWHCAAGHFGNGMIVCIVPTLDDFDMKNMQYNVDVALNGQQFTGKPIPFRFYDVTIREVSPTLIGSQGGAIMKIKGDGLYDSQFKRLKL